MCESSNGTPELERDSLGIRHSFAECVPSHSTSPTQCDSDLVAEFPASSARTALGLDRVALLGAQEQAVPHGTPRCIRVLVHCYSDRPRDQLHHVFLEGAAALRADLAGAD